MNYFLHFLLLRITFSTDPLTSVPFSSLTAVWASSRVEKCTTAELVLPAAMICSILTTVPHSEKVFVSHSDERDLAMCVTDTATDSDILGVKRGRGRCMHNNAKHIRKNTRMFTANLLAQKLRA